MPDIVQLVRRDHEELEIGLRTLVRLSVEQIDLRTVLDGVRLGLTAHAEAEDIVLYAALAQHDLPAFVEQLVAEARRAHVEQETAFHGLVCATPGSPAWRTRANHMYDLVHRHAVHEETIVLPAVRDYVPTETYAMLAGAFATERLRQLALMQPSAVYTAQAV